MGKKGGGRYKGEEEMGRCGAGLAAATLDDPAAMLDDPAATGVRHRPCCPIQGRPGRRRGTRMTSGLGGRGEVSND